MILCSLMDKTRKINIYKIRKSLYTFYNTIFGVHGIKNFNLQRDLSLV